jgi:uncharacterized protein (TIGR00369 family)
VRPPTLSDVSEKAPSYPPDGHIIRHLRLDLQSETTEELRCTMPVTDDLRDAGGALRMGALSTMVDVAAGTFSHDLVRPDWLATSDMKVHAMRPTYGDEIRSVTSTVRAGKRSVLSLTEVTDADGPVARAWVTYVRLPRRDDSPTIEEGHLTGRRLLYVEKDDPGPSASDSSPAEGRPMLDDYIGLTIREGELVFDLVHQPRIHNSFGSIQGGVAATLIERMGMLAAERSLGVPARVTDAHTYYLGQTREGPFRIEGTVLRSDATAVTTEVAVIDAGNERLLDLGTVTASRITDDQLA